MIGDGKMIIFDEEKWLLDLNEGKIDTNYMSYVVNTIIRYGLTYDLSHEELRKKFAKLDVYAYKEFEYNLHENYQKEFSYMRRIRTNEDCFAVLYKEELEWIMSVTKTHEQARILYVYLVLQKVFNFEWIYEQKKADICKLAKLKLTKIEYDDIMFSICCMDVCRKEEERDDTMPMYNYGIKYHKRTTLADEWGLETEHFIKMRDSKMHVNCYIEDGEIAFVLDGEEELYNMIEPFLELYPAPKTYIKCEVCGNEFEQVDKRKKYCSDLCSTKAKSEKARLRKRKQRAKNDSTR